MLKHQEALLRAEKIKVVVFDVDGVLSDGDAGNLPGLLFVEKLGGLDGQVGARQRHFALLPGIPPISGGAVSLFPYFLPPGRGYAGISKKFEKTVAFSPDRC